MKRPAPVVALVALVLAAMLAGVTASGARAAGVDLTGHWEAPGQGGIDLVQSGTSVSGSGPSGLRISGTVSGTTFSFAFWNGASYAACDAEDRGHGSAAFDPVANRLVGSWASEKNSAKYRGDFVLQRVSDIVIDAPDAVDSPDPTAPADLLADTVGAALEQDAVEYVGTVVGAIAALLGDTLPEPDTAPDNGGGGNSATGGASSAPSAVAPSGTGSTTSAALAALLLQVQSAQARYDALLAQRVTLSADLATAHSQQDLAEATVLRAQSALRAARTELILAQANAAAKTEALAPVDAELQALLKVAEASSEPEAYEQRIAVLQGRWALAWSAKNAAMRALYPAIAADASAQQAYDRSDAALQGSLGRVQTLTTALGQNAWDTYRTGAELFKAATAAGALIYGGSK